MPRTHPALVFRVRVAVILLLPHALASSALGDVDVRIMGEVFSASVPVSSGDPFAATFTVRPNVVSGDEDPSAQVGEYRDPTQSFSIVFDVGAFDVSCTGTTTFVNDDVSGPVSFFPGVHDRLTFRGTDCTDSQGDAPFLVRVRLGDSTATGFEGTELDDESVLDFMEVNNFGQLEVFCDAFGEDCPATGGYGFSGNLTGASAMQVPESPSGALGAAALAALVRMRRPTPRGRTAVHSAEWRTR